MRFWLMKSEPNVFSLDDLRKSPGKTTHWDGVRNFKARNYMRDEMKKGDLVLFYHSNTEVPGVVGLAEVVKEGYPDHTARDKRSKYYEPRATDEKPYWYMVDVKYKATFKRIVSLADMKANPKFEGMKVVKKGMRLSVQPVGKEHFDLVCKLGG